MANRVRGKSGKKRCFFKHYGNVMSELYEENAEKDRVGIWLRPYAFIILSGMFFPRTPYGAAWSLIQYANDVEGIGQYAWAEAIWRVVVDTIEDTQKKLCGGPLSEVQDGERFPRIASWRKVNHGGIYDANELLTKLGEKEGVLSFDERLRHAREEYVLEKEAHNHTHEEATVMKARAMELAERILQFGGLDTDDGKGGSAGARRSEDRGEDSDAEGTDKKSDNCVRRPVIGNMPNGTDVPGGSLKDDAVQQLCNDAGHNGSVSAGDMEVQYEGAYSGPNQETYGAPPSSPNVA
ncbi:LOW QUALITY PROTEIN: hypothetical protein Cgig2_006355 [Carnegiea gigantea]|uniref:Aminotransferase-like plant mobile domain-containing protein n=1 Tax=Carnegiea gigantea TaxID=171969 RepID=A0A9Q1JPL2_9CARY|nr:LOW QUALITY PROTEIN: hypothetical protein Cgig2_006355 [Carnegiea gigantea]